MCQLLWKCQRDILDMAIFEQNLKLLLYCYVQASVHAFNRANVHVVQWGKLLGYQLLQYRSLWSKWVGCYSTLVETESLPGYITLPIIKTILFSTGSDFSGLSALLQLDHLKLWDSTLTLENHSVKHFLYGKKKLENLLLVFQCIDVLII